MEPYNEDERKKRKKDTFEKLFEEMMKKVDNMMREEFEENQLQEDEWPEANKDITFSFSITPGSEHPMGINQSRETPEKETKNQMHDIIEGKQKIKVLLEAPGEKEEDIKTQLKDNKITIKTSNFMKELPLPKKAKEIKKKRYKNGVLEINILKKD